MSIKSGKNTFTNDEVKIVMVSKSGERVELTGMESVELVFDGEKSTALEAFSVKVVSEKPVTPTNTTPPECRKESVHGYAIDGNGNYIDRNGALQ